jgi:hypothetical protein
LVTNFPTLIRSSKHVSAIFKQRLHDQHIQNWRHKLEQSTRFTVLNQVKGTFGRSTYLSIIKNPSVRNVFTRLRVDMNVLQTCKSKTQQNILNCPFCTNCIETVGHFLFHCHHYEQQRKALFGVLQENVCNFRLLSEMEKMKIILNLDTRRIIKNIPHTISAIIKFINESYLSRSKQNDG